VTTSPDERDPADADPVGEAAQVDDTEPVDEARVRDALAATVSALAVAGKATGRAAAWVGRGVAAAYLSIDPDVRMHLADVPLLAPTLLARREQIVEALPDDGRAPIVCVHGLAGHPQNFLGLRAVMWLHGRRRFYTFGYDEREPLERAAEGLARTLHEVARVNGLAADARVDLVAHSMGGLVARLALLDGAFAARVRTFVTLGTPHHGTLAARFIATSRGLDLRPGSPVLERVAAQVPWRSPPRLVAFWSPADVLMLPATTARVDGADNREIPGVSHVGYLTRPRALARVQEALDD
jgi:pimeloyl-ACP methyl ester carboxylesterase